MTFYQLLKQLLPQGPYPDDDGSAFLRLLNVLALGLTGVSTNLDALELEFFPDTTEALIGDWERAYGIVDTDATPLYLRRQKLLAKINARPGLSVQDIQDSLFPFLGYDAEITEQGLFRCDDPRSLTDRDPLIEPEDEVYLFLVIVDGALITTPGFDRTVVQAFLDEIKPAHTQGDITFTMFACDDPYSLTDRDLLAV